MDAVLREDRLHEPGRPGATIWLRQRTVSPFHVLFAFLSVLSLYSIFGFPFVPSQDGPSHFYNASILANYDAWPTVQNYFSLSVPAAGNLTTHLFLGILIPFTGELLAEKILLSVLVISLPLSLYLLLRVIPGGNVYFSLWGFLLAKNELFYLGFWNFVGGISLMCVTVAFAIASERDLRWFRIAGLSALSGLLYFTHSVPWALCVAMLGIGLGVRGVQAWREAGWGAVASTLKARVWGVAAILWPAAILAWYVIGSERLQGSSLGYSLRAKAWHFYSGSFLGTGFDGGRLVAAATMLAILTLTIFALLLRLRGRVRLEPSDLFLGMTAMCGAGLALLPISVGSMSYTQNRMALFMAVFLFLWFGFQRWPVIIGRGIVALSVLLTVGHEYSAIRYSAHWEPVLSEVRSARSQIQSGDVVVAAVANRGQEAHASPLAHAAGYWAGVDFVNLWNYEAATPHFPVSFRKEVSPVGVFSSDKKMGMIPPLFSIADYEQATSGRVELVALIGLDGNRIERDMPGKSWDPGGNFRLEWVSQPNGLVRMYRRQPLMTNTEGAND